MFNLPFLNKKRSAQKADAVDGGIKTIGFLAACAFLFSSLLLIALTYESIHENQSEIVELVLGIPSALFQAFALLLAFLSFVALIASVTAIKWQRAKSEAFALAKVQETQVIKADQAADSTEQMVKLFAAMAALNQGGKTDSKLLEALQGLQAPQLVAPPQITVQDMDHDLADFINNEECILIHGPKGSGKTTVLHHLVYRRLYQLGHEVVVIDPHRTPSKWYESSVIGGGRDYETIFEALNGYEEMMSARYDELDSGLVEEGDHPHLTLIIDEYRSIVKAQQKSIYKKRYNLDSIPALLTEGRKVNMWIALVSHSKSVKSLGLEGEGDLREGFVFLHLKREANGTKTATASLNAEAHLPCKLLGQAPKGRFLPRNNAGPTKNQSRTGHRTDFEDDQDGQGQGQDRQKQEQDGQNMRLGRGSRTAFESPEDMVSYLKGEGFSDKEIIRELLNSKFEERLLSGTKLRGYLGIGRSKCFKLLAEVKAEQAPKKKTVKIFGTNGHLNGHH